MGLIVQKFGGSSVKDAAHIRNVAQIIDPEAFVIGGGVARAGSIITESIEKYYNDSVMFALRGKQFNLAELGNDAGIYGAVRMVL